MMNSKKWLIIILCILFFLILIALCFSINNNKDSSIIIKSKDVRDFNNKFEGYDNEQSGSQVKKLLGILSSNANTQKENPERLPKVSYVDASNTEKVTAKGGIDSSGKNIGSYTLALQKIQNSINTTHTYFVEFDYEDNSGILSVVTIYFNKVE